jgi:nucleoside 2-deoxyribosyltransferase
MRDQYYQAVTHAGCEVVDPWRRMPSPQPDLMELMTIGRENAKDIDASDESWLPRWSRCGSGTAAEIGYAAARGKWIIGYRGDLRRTGESPHVAVNLMEYFIRQSGEAIVTSLAELTAILKRQLTTRPGARL